MLPNRSPGLAPDERRPAPGAAQRLRLAALRSIAATASSTAAADVLRIVASDVAEHAAACLGDSFPPAIHNAASEVGCLLATQTLGQLMSCGCTEDMQMCKRTLLHCQLCVDRWPPPSSGMEHAWTRNTMRHLTAGPAGAGGGRL
jgi:hypothetical protein